jgi:hypothetical protein
LPISPTLAGKWLAHFRSSLDSAVSDADARRAIYDDVRLMAMALVNEGEPPSALGARPHGTCLRHGPAIESLGLARRGDAAKLRALLRHAPEVLASAPHAVTLLHLAALAGRAAVVELLLRSGVDVNKPSPIETLIFVTPLCAARAKRRKEIELLLVRHGGKENIFTHAFLGDLGRLQEDLVREPSSSQTVDPAVDALEITPIHHTVAGARVDALRALHLHTSQTRAPRWSRCCSSMEQTRRALAQGVGFSIPSSRRCSRALEPASTDRDRGLGSHAREIKAEKMIPNTSPRSFAMARVRMTGDSRARRSTQGARPPSTTPPRQVS